MFEFYTISYEDNKWANHSLKGIYEVPNINGVWFVLGKKYTDDDKFICLDVAETGKGIAKEINDDIGFTHYDCSNLVMDYDATNMFGEYMFTCNREKFREYLWSYTKKKYPILRFVIISKDIEDQNERHDLERYIAYKFNAIHWRDGIPYKIKDNKKRKEQIINDCCLKFEKKESYKGLSEAISSLI